MTIMAFAQSLSGVLPVVNVQGLFPWCPVLQTPHPDHCKKELHMYCVQAIKLLSDCSLLRSIAECLFLKLAGRDGMVT